jgi:hypothetical protein
MGTDGNGGEWRAHIFGPVVKNTNEGVERAGERPQVVGQRPSQAAGGQHTEASDRRHRAGDAFMRTLQFDRRVDEDHIEGLRALQRSLDRHYWPSLTSAANVTC